MTAATLISSNRARDVATLHPDARQLRHQAVVWAMQHGRSLDFDALTIILAAKEAADGAMTSWTEDDIWHLWWVDLMAWCRLRSVAVPKELPVTFASFFQHLHDVGGFSIQSDSLEDLLAALDAAGARPRHPSAQPVG